MQMKLSDVCKPLFSSIIYLLYLYIATECPQACSDNHSHAALVPVGSLNGTLPLHFTNYCTCINRQCLISLVTVTKVYSVSKKKSYKVWLIQLLTS